MSVNAKVVEVVLDAHFQSATGPLGDRCTCGWAGERWEDHRNEAVVEAVLAEAARSTAVQPTPRFVGVVTRYGALHLAERSLVTGDRHFTLCSGTSAWTIESWAANPDHPSLTVEQMKALPMCVRCAEAAKRRVYG